MLSELRVALRSLFKSPGFSVAAILTLALGIGANTTIFSLVNATLLRRLPYPRAEQLVSISVANPKTGQRGAALSVGGYEFLRDHSHSFQELVGITSESLTLTGKSEPEQVRAGRVTHNYIPALGVPPVLGRNFSAEEDQPGAKPVAILSQALWNRRFAGDPNVIGRDFIANGIPYTVIGVMGANFDPGRDRDMWVTNLMGYSGFTPEQMRLGSGFITLLGRLKDNVSRQQAEAELGVAAKQYQRDNPARMDADPQSVVRIEPLADVLVQDFRATLLVLLAAVGVVLLIACGNVAALLLARAAGRSHDLAIRAAMGATRRHLIGHVLAESVLIALAGGLTGFLLASLATPALAAMRDFGITEPRQVQWSVPVMCFVLGLSLATTLLFGWLPAMQSSRPDLAPVLRESGRGGDGSRARHRVRGALVVGQVALSVVLLVGAGLLMRSFLELQQVDPGFDSKGTLTLRVSLPASRYPGDAARVAYMDRALEALRAIPGVESAGAALTLPMQGMVMAPVIRSTDARVPFAQRTMAQWHSATAGYFETMKVRLLKGRRFSENDQRESRIVVVVNETMARTFWPGEDPIGKHLLIARAELDSEVVGVIADVKSMGLENVPRAEMYTPYPQRTWPSMSLVVRTAGGDPMQIANSVRAQLLPLDHDLPLTQVRSMESIVAESIGQRRVMLWLSGGFAGVALLLAVVGLYGTVAYSMAQRTREIGIRMALGARFGDICTMVLSEGLRLAVAGTALGIAIALGLTRWIAGMLYGVRPTEPSVYGGMALLFVGVAALASFIPAWRAARSNPAETLR